jgi:hypothetical protein
MPTCESRSRCCTSTGPPGPISLAEAGDVTQPYFQYRATLSTRHEGATPRLHHVTIRGD